MLKKFAFPVGLWYNKSYCAVLAVTFYMSLSAGSGKDIITLDKAFRKGILQGIPIALGYLSVSFGFGIMAVRAGLSVSAAVAISITNVTSAGQAAGVGVIAAGGSAQSGTICPAYMYGLILIAFLGWTLGTLLGAAAGQILPKFIIDAMGIVLYGMFLAIIVPVSRKKKSVLAVVALAAACSILFRYVFTAVSSGFAIILCAVLASIFGAIVFPIPEEERT